MYLDDNLWLKIDLAKTPAWRVLDPIMVEPGIDQFEGVTIIEVGGWARPP